MTSDATPAQAAATPGQAARKAWNDHWAGPDPYPAGESQEETFERVWDDIAQAVLNGAFPGLKRELADVTAERNILRGHAKLREAERDRLSDRVEEVTGQLRAVTDERDEARAELADAAAIAASWPKCPDGCGCRLGTEDADNRECACDGPCCMECRENGYPDAPSYRDLAVRHAMDERDEAREQLRQWQARHEQLAVRLDEAGVQLITTHGDLGDARELAAKILGHFTATGSGHGARVGYKFFSLAQVAAWRKRAGLDAP